MSDPHDAEALSRWLGSAPGRYLLAWEQERIDQAVVDVFGFHAVQLGQPELNALRANRMPHRWCASDMAHVSEPVLPPGPPGDSGAQDGLPGDSVAPDGLQPPAGLPSAVVLSCDFDALPFPNNSLDLVVLPHTLELARDPHRTLREVERVLVPEGRVAILGFNPMSLWALRQRGGRLRRYFGGKAGLYLPRTGEFIGYWRLRDWLRLLSFEVEGGSFGCYRPPVTSQKWLDRFAWVERSGDRWWPVLGAAYFLVAVKRVRGMRLVGMVRQQRSKSKSAPAVVANRHRRMK
jgi:SAM-dependent methyltransferase